MTISGAVSDSFWSQTKMTGAHCLQAKCALDRSYVPDFKKAFQHFLLHTGGRGVIDDLETTLKLDAKQVQPSKDTLFRFGNTSAASTWYILARIESSTGLRRGDRIWQLGEEALPRLRVLLALSLLLLQPP